MINIQASSTINLIAIKNVLDIPLDNLWDGEGVWTVSISIIVFFNKPLRKGSLWVTLFVFLQPTLSIPSNKSICSFFNSSNCLLVLFKNDQINRILFFAATDRLGFSDVCVWKKNIDTSKEFWFVVRYYFFLELIICVWFFNTLTRVEIWYQGQLTHGFNSF